MQSKKYNDDKRLSKINDINFDTMSREEIIKIVEDILSELNIPEEIDTRTKAVLSNSDAYLLRNLKEKIGYGIKNRGKEFWPAKIYMQLGHISYLRGNYIGAIKSYMIAQSLEPNDLN
ncbi:MAG: hypothetical protein AB1779_04540, partial [Candidatus Thermoplasmatota archaeon]